MIKPLLMLALLLPAAFAYLQWSEARGFSQEDMAPALVEQIEDTWQPLKVTGNAVPWETFATTKEHELCEGQDEEGYDICFITPEYSDAIKRLDGKEVTLMGYMFPLEHTEKHDTFLMGPYPLSCPFHYHVGSSQIVEAIAQKPIAFSYDPVTLTGTLKLRSNKETGIFYYLENATYSH